MKKIVAVLLIIATLCLPLCGLANTKEVANEMFSLTNDWIITGKNEFVEDMIVMVWVKEADCFALPTIARTIFITHTMPNCLWPLVLPPPLRMMIWYMALTGFSA